MFLPVFAEIIRQCHQTLGKMNVLYDHIIRCLKIEMCKIPDCLDPVLHQDICHFLGFILLSRLERKYKMFMRGGDAQSLEKVFVRKFAQIDRLYEAKEDHDHDISFIKKNMNVMFSKYGVEKYDAFDDVGGKLSFALALLDKNNTGLILNAVHSRDNCFLYLKEIVKGESYVVLSQEEVEALRKAVNFGLGEIEKE